MPAPTNTLAWVEWIDYGLAEGGTLPRRSNASIHFADAVRAILDAAAKVEELGIARQLRPFLHDSIEHVRLVAAVGDAVQLPHSGADLLGGGENLRGEAEAIHK